MKWIILYTVIVTLTLILDHQVHKNDVERS
jgi:hypothetical protein